MHKTMRSLCCSSSTQREKREKRIFLHFPRIFPLEIGSNDPPAQPPPHLPKLYYYYSLSLLPPLPSIETSSFGSNLQKVPGMSPPRHSSPHLKLYCPRGRERRVRERKGGPFSKCLRYEKGSLLLLPLFLLE